MKSWAFLSNKLSNAKHENQTPYIFHSYCSIKIIFEEILNVTIINTFNMLEQS